MIIPRCFTDYKELTVMMIGGYGWGVPNLTSYLIFSTNLTSFYNLTKLLNKGNFRPYTRVKCSVTVLTWNLTYFFNLKS